MHVRIPRLACLPRPNRWPQKTKLGWETYHLLFILYFAKSTNHKMGLRRSFGRAGRERGVAVANCRRLGIKSPRDSSGWPTTLRVLARTTTKTISALSCLSTGQRVWKPILHIGSAVGFIVSAVLGENDNSSSLVEGSRGWGKRVRGHTYTPAAFSTFHNY